MNIKTSTFRFLCQKDIKVIYDIVNEYLLDCDIDSLNQSIIYEEDRKIICKSIKNNYNEKIGKELVIHVYDTGDTYKIKDRLDSIIYEKNNRDTEEKVVIVLNNYTLMRHFLFKNGDLISTSEEIYNLKSKNEFKNYLDSDSVEMCIYKLKNKNKIRKRT